jgi:hypothetical protein
VATGVNNGNGNAYGLDNGNNTATLPINFHRATAAWSEDAVTFTTFAQHFDAQIAAVILPSGTGALKSVDLTALVRAWVSGAQPNHGVLLETADKKRTFFVASESTATSYRPALEVCYAVVDEHCAPNPCLNAGVCVNGWTGYTCQCAPGFTGTNCETNIDDCASAPCLNGGTCVDEVSSYTCQCAPGFTGTNCETNIDDCAPAPCQNGGVCTDGVNGYACACPPGFGGASCETNIDECAGNPCLNGASCVDGVASYTCACSPGFTGTNCETDIDECAGNPCLNGASCVDGIASYTCACLPGFTGALCETNIDDCAANPCLHGGVCADGVNGYTCACAAGYAGNNCEIDINDCTGSPCQNGGICVDGVNSYTCSCSGGYTGTNCETPPAPPCPCSGDPVWEAVLHNYSLTPSYGNDATYVAYGVQDVVYIAALTSEYPDSYGNAQCMADIFDPYQETRLYITDTQAAACMALIIAAADFCSPNPCQNGGTCTNGAGTYACACPSGWTGTNCETPAAPPCPCSGDPVWEAVLHNYSLTPSYGNDATYVAYGVQDVVYIAALTSEYPDSYGNAQCMADIFDPYQETRLYITDTQAAACMALIIAAGSSPP